MPVAQDDVLMPGDAGVGFLDVGCGTPGTHLSKFSSQTMQSWATAFYTRLKTHRERAAKQIGYESPEHTICTRSLYVAHCITQLHLYSQLKRLEE